MNTDRPSPQRAAVLWLSEYRLTGLGHLDAAGMLMAFRAGYEEGVEREREAHLHTPHPAAREPESIKLARESVRRFEAQKAAEREAELAEVVRAAEERGAARLLGDESTLRVNVLRSWDDRRRESFALHLLGDAYLALVNAAKEWREHDRKYQAIEVTEDVGTAVELFRASADCEPFLDALRAAADELLRAHTEHVPAGTFDGSRHEGGEDFGRLLYEGVVGEKVDGEGEGRE